jgi:two-component system, NtrC family, sensor kinase
MKKTIVLFVFFSMIWNPGFAQDESFVDSLKQKLATASQDTTRVKLMNELSNHYKFDRPDSTLFYGYKAVTLARQINFPSGEALAMAFICVAQRTLGNDAKALELILKSIKFDEKHNLIQDKALLLHQLGSIYSNSKNYVKALSLYRESKRLSDSLHNINFSVLSLSEIGNVYLNMDQLDSALYYAQLAYKAGDRLKSDWLAHPALLTLGKIQIIKGNTDFALAYFRQSLLLRVSAHFKFKSNLAIAKLYQQTGSRDSSIYYTRKALEIARDGSFYSDIIDASLLLSDIYEERDPQIAFQYNKMAIAYKDSLYNLSKTAAFETSLDFDEQERQNEIETAKTAYRSRVQRLWLFSISGALITAVILSFVLYRNNKNKQRSNALLKMQKKEIQDTLEKLKSTQAQLIQSEKMASLGDLTAGIAHEIQNPLNFVNNFSELNKELVDELQHELKDGKTDDAIAISNDIKENEEKINHHGKRADAIVKGMLQHSKTSSGQKELTDINALADEYLRLAYHGLRAKDKTFNAKFETDFDPSTGQINLIPQDIGRVILNLINNSFYAVTEKKKTAGPDYEPTVIVKTKAIKPPLEGLGVLISVKDNGNGIPQKVLDKIFQPFFTTKPTGQGTGLGLSLSYDIVKAHGGEIKVNTREGQFTEFVVQLPVSV